MGSKIIKFPGVQQMEPEFELDLEDVYCEITVEDIPEVDIPEVDIPEVDDIDINLMYSENENYITRGVCYRCGHVFDEDEHVWYIRQQAVYGSQLDGSEVSIQICDTCLVDFLGRNLSHK